MRERGEAVHARPMPCRRFFLTLRARPFVMGGFSGTLYSVGETGEAGKKGRQSEHFESYLL